MGDGMQGTGEPAASCPPPGDAPAVQPARVWPIRAFRPAGAMFAFTSRQRFTVSEYASGALLLPVCVYFAVVPYGQPGGLGLPWFLVHSLNLLPHEAGHFVFRFFGETLMIAGGSILQLVFPCLWAWIAFASDSRLGVQVSLVWLGQNWIDVAAYAADAQARAMPLLGGLGPEAHDWYNLLSRAGWLDQTPLVAGGLFACAFPVWAAMLAVPRWVG